MPIYETVFKIQVQADDELEAYKINRNLHHDLLARTEVEHVLKNAPRITSYPDRFWSEIRESIPRVQP